MKIFILFTLVALTLCDDDSSSSSGLTEDPSSSSSDGTEDKSSFQCDKPYENKHANEESCFKTTLEEVPELAHDAEKLFCKYRNHKEDKTDEYLEEAKRDATALVSCSGCTVGELADLQKELGGLGKEAGGAGAGVAVILSKLADSLGILEPVADITCYLLSGLLTSKCLEHITNSDVPEIADNLNKLVCLADEETLDVKLVLETLVDLDCVTGEALGLDVKQWEFSIPVAGSITPILQGLIESVKALDVVGPILDPTLCALTQPVGNIVDGSNGDILGEEGSIVTALAGGFP